MYSLVSYSLINATRDYYKIQDGCSDYVRLADDLKHIAPHYIDRGRP